MQIIHSWLKGKQNFIVGTAIYKAVGSNQDLKNLLAKGETAFAKKRLIEELEKLLIPQVPRELATTTKVPDIPVGDMPHGAPVVPEPELERETDVMPDSDDAVLHALQNEWKEPYQRMNLLRHELDKFDGLNTPDAMAWRKPRAKEIKELEQKCIAIWAKRDHYKKEGKLPFVVETKLAIPSDPIELAQMISNIKKYIRRYRKHMKDKPDEPKFAQLYQEYKKQHLQVTGKEYEEKD